ncbi:hypothetical protein N7462_009968 [Penicillium macrosclerotiorum]|uniref:uncharacterized protein n=1 Tax=Penicillium macrosclerotiorum TaxID=303699 RepID=UPI00254858B6|nr:uncharacterized protein N7462_009968 [Penicillium macrosclerotiorum]KAJ5668898.1 hypothetical protein N7462_009968 [Penicillium macrosclerotiorum]
MFKALMGGGRPSSASDTRRSSSSKSNRRKTDNKSISSRKSSRGDDRDRGLGDLSVYTSSVSGSQRGPVSVAGDSVASTYVTAEPDAIENPERTIIERVPKRRESDRESKSSRRRDRDRSESRDRDQRRSRRGTDDGRDGDLDRERDRREHRRTKSGDPYVPPISTSMPSSAPGAQFAADIAAPGFSQFPMQYDSGMPSTSVSPGHDTSPAPYDPHVQQQFPGQFPTGVAQPYLPHNPAGAAADYYGDQGQSVQDQPGVRPHQPEVIPNSQTHLMTASPSANPPPEPSSIGQVGAAAAYYADEAEGVVELQNNPSSGLASKPPKPGKPYKPSSQSKPSKPSSSSAAAISGAAAAAGAITYGQAPHSSGVGAGIGMAAAGAAAGYMLGHQHHPSSPEHSSQYTFQNYEQSSQGGISPYGAHPNNAMVAAGAAGAAGYAAHAAYTPGYYPYRPGSLALQHRHRGPLSRFVDFWRDPEGVGRFEDYTETIGVCKYCFEPGTTSVDAPRKHHYHGRRHSSDRYSSGGSSRVNKLNRYHSSEDESRRRKRSKKSSSWLPGMLAGYAAKSIFTGKGFDDSYSVRSGRVAGDRIASHDGESVFNDQTSYTSRGVVRRSERSSPRESHSDSKQSRRTRSRSRSSSRSRHSFVKEAALGAAVGSAALAMSKHRRSRSRSPSRTQRRKDSSSSGSFVNVSRPATKSIGGFASFFTSASENRKTKRNKKSRTFFSFNSSSSSSLDADLAFGSGFTKKSSTKLQKKQNKKGQKNKDVDAALIGLGATATALAAASHRHGRTTGQMMTSREGRSSNYNSSATIEDEWVDAESEEDRSSSASSALAFGGSSAESSSDSNSSGGWRWGWGGKKKKRSEKKHSGAETALAVGAGALGGAALASVARHRDSRVSSSAGSLQQVYPMPTSDPSRFDVANVSPSVMSVDQTPLVRPGPIPLQQPQPYTPVSQAVYTTQGVLPGSIPAYSAPAVPPIFANEHDRYNLQYEGSQTISTGKTSAIAERRQHRRSDSSPVFSTQESYVPTPSRRSTVRDQASVSFDLTEEQAERERRLSRRDRDSRDDFGEERVQLIDREEELAHEDAERRERRERRYKEREDEKRRTDSDKDNKSSASWVEAAAVGAIGAAAASSIISYSRKKDEEVASETSARRRDERREQRRAERRAESSVLSKSDVSQPIEEVAVVEPRETPSPRKRNTRPAPVHDDYAEFYAPEEIRHSPDRTSRTRDRDSDDTPTIVEIVPASERVKNNDMPRDDLPQFAQEPYENHDHLPWPVPRLNFIEPTPPQSINGSVRGTSTPITPTEPEPQVGKSGDEDRERPSTGSRVSWGTPETHEYEVLSSSEQDPLEQHDISPLEEATKELPMQTSENGKSKEISANPVYGTDIDFAATVAAATQAAGFDPSFVINDPKYHTRTSPPGSEDEGTFSPRSKWTDPSMPVQPHVEGEIDSYEPSKSRDIDLSLEHVIDDKPFYAEPESFSKDKDVSFSETRDRGSIAQEVIEQLNGKTPRFDSPENDVYSMPGGFETPDNTRDVSMSRDSRSVVSAPLERESEKSSKSRKSRRSGDDFDFPPKTESSVPEDFDVIDEEKTKRRKHRSKRESDTFSVDEDTRSVVTSIEDDKSERRKRRSKRDSEMFSVDDDARSAVTSLEDLEKSERRKHRHRSSRDTFDDTASITSSPARIDETREKRRSKDSKDSKEEKEKSSGILRSLFGSRVSAPPERTRSSSLDKRSARDVMSEVGVDEERRHRKKRSSRHRSSSGGDALDEHNSDNDVRSRDDLNLEEYRSQRQQKEERRRHRYEEIVESGKRRESEKV